jgi:hypothetical protein
VEQFCDLWKFGAGFGYFATMKVPVMVVGWMSQWK